MHETLQEICDALDSLASKISNVSDARPLNEMVGWHLPPLTKTDISNMVSDFSESIKLLKIESLDSEFESRLQMLPQKIRTLEVTNLQYMFNSNGKYGIPVFFMTFDWIKSELSPLISWEILQDKNALPRKLSNKLKSIQSDLDGMMPDKDAISEKLDLIKKAKETIDELPSVIDELTDAKKGIEKNRDSSTVLFNKITELHKDSEEKFNNIKHQSLASEAIVEQCEEAYRITTTKGLAAAFEKRAGELNNSMWWWVALLLLALVMGGIIGSYRFETLTEVIKGKNLNTGIIAMEFVISILSVGAPIWFAWIATKQIGQRFKLAEDYGFKATVAKAYEGYKKEAIRLDQNLELRLFSSALSRLEEAPLRLMEDKTHGSPWQEFFESEQFRKAMNEVPGFRDKLIGLAKEKVPSLGKINGTAVLSKEEGGE